MISFIETVTWQYTEHSALAKLPLCSAKNDVLVNSSQFKTI